MKNGIDKEIRLQASQTCVIVIDPQKGFTSEGSFGKAFSKKDIKPIEESFEKLENFINALPPEVYRIFVKSQYRKGQFTSGQLHEPLSSLCVPEAHNNDMEFAITKPSEETLVYKSQNNSLASPEFLQ